MYSLLQISFQKNLSYIETSYLTGSVNISVLTISLIIKTAVKAAPLCVNVFKIDVTAKNGNKKHL